MNLILKATIFTKGWLVVPHRERTRERAPYKPPIDISVKFYTYYCLFPTLGLLRLFLSHNQYAIALYCDEQVSKTLLLYNYTVYKCVLYSNPEQAHIHSWRKRLC